MGGGTFARSLAPKTGHFYIIEIRRHLSVHIDFQELVFPIGPTLYCHRPDIYLIHVDQGDNRSSRRELGHQGGHVFRDTGAALQRIEVAQPAVKQAARGAPCA